MRWRTRKNLRRSQRGALVVGTALVAAACGDIFDVVNPGPITDDALEQAAAGKTVFFGVVADVEYGVNWVTFFSALASGDVTPDATRPWSQAPGEGKLLPLDGGWVWDRGQLGRWAAEAGIERLKRTQPDPDRNPLVAGAHLWAGYANRLMGDNMCVTVIDGGAPQEWTEWYKRAVNHFETARSMATAIGARLDTVRLAAIAGLAQSHLILGNYDQAASFARQIPDNYLWVAHRSEVSSREYNWTYQETHEITQVTVWGTYVDSLGPGADPRTPYLRTGKKGAGGTKPFYQQRKYPARGSDIPLAKGREMRLIEAEVLLRKGDVAGAMALINRVRSLVGVAPVTAATAADAWVALDRERMLELWIEGRRLKDRQRFSDPRLSAWSVAFMRGRDRCFPPSQKELDTNRNIPGWPVPGLKLP